MDESSKVLRQSLVIDGLADDVARWQMEAMQYRELALVAIEQIARLTNERDRAREQSQHLRDELRSTRARASR